MHDIVIGMQGVDKHAIHFVVGLGERTGRYNKPCYPVKAHRVLAQGSVSMIVRVLCDIDYKRGCALA